MADNFTTLDASDASITGAADEIGGVKFPRVKLIHGADGTNDGDVASGNPLPVVQTGALPAGTNAIGKLAANSGVDIGDVDVTSSALPTGASTSAKQDDQTALLTTIDGDTSNIATSLGNMDNAVDGNYLNVNANLAGTDITGGAGAVGASTPRVTLASDDPAVAKLTTIDSDTSALAGCVGGTELQVDIVSSALPTGAATSALQGGGLPAALGAGGGLKVDGSGTALPVSLASVPSHAVTNAGTFATQVDGAALTALQLIDDPVIADDAAFTPATTKVMMAGFEADESSTDSVDEGDGGAARMTLDRKVIVNPQPHTVGGLSIFRSIDLDESEEEVKSSAGQVYGWYVMNKNAATLFLKLYNDTAANVVVGTTTPVMTIPIPTGAAANVSFTHGIAFSTAITAAVTTGVADNDTGAPSNNDFVANIFYK